MSDWRDDDHEKPDLPAPTPGEQLLSALGRLHTHAARAELRELVAVAVVELLADGLGLAGKVEFATVDEDGVTNFHLPAEVLQVVPGDRFPWRLGDAAPHAGANSRPLGLHLERVWQLQGEALAKLEQTADPSSGQHEPRAAETLRQLARAATCSRDT